MMLKKNRNDTLTEKSIARGTILDPSRVEGYCVDLAYEICHEKLKLPYKFLIETKYGNEIDKGVWNGMIGALVNREADLSIATLTINGAREKAVDFSKPFIDLGISIMIRKPEKQKPGVFSFMDPLSKEIWVCVIISYLLVSTILFFVSRFSSYEWYFENESDVQPLNKFTMHNSLFFAFAAFMHQGVDLLPRSISGETAWELFPWKRFSSFFSSRSSGHQCLVVFQFDSCLLLYCQSSGFSHRGETRDTDWNSGRSGQTNWYPIWHVERRLNDGVLQQIDFDHI